MTKEKDRFEELLVESFYVAIDAADPHKVVPPHIPSTFQGDVVVVGAGKGLPPVWLQRWSRLGRKKI